MNKRHNKERQHIRATSSKGLKEYNGSKSQKQEDLYLKKALHQMESEISLPSDKIFERIRNKIATQEQERPLDEHVKKNEGSGTRILERIRGLFSSPSLAWGLCGAQAIVLVFAFLVFESGNPRFETMSYGQNSSHNQVFNVIFKKDIKFGDVVSFLQRHHMKIINGPLGKDLFVIEIKNKKDLEGLKKSGILEFIGKVY